MASIPIFVNERNSCTKRDVTFDTCDYPMWKVWGNFIMLMTSGERKREGAGGIDLSRPQRRNRKRERGGWHWPIITLPLYWVQLT